MDLAAEGTVGLRVASAYTTLAGSALLFDALVQSVGERDFVAMPKTLVTCFDFGITEPGALRRWLSLDNTSVRVAKVDDIALSSKRPSTAFHPKLYAFDLDEQTSNLLVGSANLTSRGFTVNTEVGWSQRAVSSALVGKTFSSLSRVTLPLTVAMLDAYEEQYQRRPHTDRHPEAEPVRSFSPTGQLSSFRDAVQSKQVDLAACDALWVSADALQGGSRNQLELPRGGHQFFGFSFADYDYPHNRTIGHPLLRLGSRSWTDRPLTWHGNNRMERLNLPTQAQGGPAYAGSVIMFRRLEDGFFELVVTPSGSDLANAWAAASSQSGCLFRLGATATRRLVGLLP